MRFERRCRPVQQGQSRRAGRGLPLADVLREIFPVRVTSEAESLDVRHGRPIPLTGEDGLVGVFDAGGSALALMEPRGQVLRVVVGFTGT